MRRVVLPLLVLAVGGAVWLLGRDAADAPVGAPTSAAPPSAAAPDTSEPPAFHGDAPAPKADPSPLVAMPGTRPPASGLAPVAVAIPGPPVPTRTVSGHVVRASDGSPIGGISVQYKDADLDVLVLSRDADGAFALEHVAQTGEALQLGGPRGTQKVPIVPGAGDITGFTCVFDTGFRIEGRVLDERGAPVEGAQVEDNNPHRGLVTDASGRFRMNDVVTKKAGVRVLVTADGHVVEKTDVPAPAAVTDIVSVEIRLRDAGRIAGRVFLPGGEPAGKATVKLGVPADSGPEAPATAWGGTDESGHFDIDHVPPGRYRVEVEAERPKAAANSKDPVGSPQPFSNSAIHNTIDLSATVRDVFVTAGQVSNLDIVVQPSP